MALGLYRRIAARHPEAERVLCLPQAFVDLPLEPGLFHRVRGLSLTERKDFRGITQLTRWLRSEKFGRAYLLPTSVRSALPFFFAGIPERIGFASRANRWLLTTPTPWPGVASGRHKAEQYESLVATAAVAGSRPPPVTRERQILLAPGASIELREWPLYEALVPALRAQYPDYEIAITGTHHEERVQALARDLRPQGVKNLVGKTSLPELLSHCARAALVIANDSGVAHFAATLSGAPTVVLFGPGDPRYVKPQGDSVVVVRNENLSCSPCESATCRGPHGYQACLKTVSVDQVMTAVQTILGKPQAA